MLMMMMIMVLVAVLPGCASVGSALLNPKYSNSEQSSSVLMIGKTDSYSSAFIDGRALLNNVDPDVDTIVWVIIFIVFAVIFTASTYAASIIAAERSVVPQISSLNKLRVLIAGCWATLTTASNMAITVIALYSGVPYFAAVLLLVRSTYFFHSYTTLASARNKHELLVEPADRYMIAVRSMLFIHMDAITYLPWRHGDEELTHGFPSKELMNITLHCNSVILILLAYVSLKAYFLLTAVLGHHVSIWSITLIISFGSCILMLIGNIVVTLIMNDVRSRDWARRSNAFDPANENERSCRRMFDQFFPPVAPFSVLQSSEAAEV
jgi:hypothetical protein